MVLRFSYRPILPAHVKECLLKRFLTPAEAAASADTSPPEFRKRSPKRLPFVDRIVIEASAGKGGDGAVAFHREKFKPLGGPSGGHGGVGGCIYIETDPKLFGLASVPKHVRAGPGNAGGGSWLHGRRGTDYVLKVPTGVIIRELDQSSDQSIDTESEEERLRRLYVSYPTAKEYYTDSPHFKKVDTMFRKNSLRASRQANDRKLIDLDLSSPTVEPILLCRGGDAGTGNSAFGTDSKFATRGRPGQALRLELELKLLADVALVGEPNAGKSSFLRMVSNSKTTAASYAFTTLEPHIGTIIMFSDHTFRCDWHTQQPRTDHDRQEVFRFTLADLPGLLINAHQNFGLGHSFLRHIERSRLLAYIIDLSQPNPTIQLDVLRNELEEYQKGLSRRGSLVIANKSDLCSPEDGVSRLADVQNWVDNDGGGLVVPTSALQGGNVGKALQAMQRLLIEETLAPHAKSITSRRI